MKKNRQTTLIKGVCGRLEARHNLSELDASTVIRLVVLSHPHPLFGGTMNNKVVTTMERAFQSLGYATVAYNFRGVGQSDGEYDEGVGETDDLLSVLDWVRSRHTVEEVILAGFSFGSYVSLRALPQTGANRICTVAPPIGLYDFSALDKVDVPWSCIQGGRDEVVESEEVLSWVTKPGQCADLYWRAGASHFFHGELVWLKKVILSIY
ncbi:alpha/beta fold hydrolase [Thiomicrorhabdus sp.]|uniref:alpha/beta hydrolase n=1 Tax=Thiomicrorhabdus sp. TaxID=2039724 RepID=UPI0029C95CE3|nr:alpha/beta fold hydrolase [Thiomicrorhabdus sp.]